MKNKLLMALIALLITIKSNFETEPNNERKSN